MDKPFSECYPKRKTPPYGLATRLVAAAACWALVTTTVGLVFGIIAHFAPNGPGFVEGFSSAMLYANIFLGGLFALIVVAGLLIEVFNYLFDIAVGNR